MAKIEGRFVLGGVRVAGSVCVRVCSTDDSLLLHLCESTLLSIHKQTLCCYMLLGKKAEEEEVKKVKMKGGWWGVGCRRN